MSLWNRSPIVLHVCKTLLKSIYTDQLCPANTHKKYTRFHLLRSCKLLFLLASLFSFSSLLLYLNNLLHKSRTDHCGLFISSEPELFHYAPLSEKIYSDSSHSSGKVRYLSWFYSSVTEHALWKGPEIYSIGLFFSPGFKAGGGVVLSVFIMQIEICDPTL